MQPSLQRSPPGLVSCTSYEAAATVTEEAATTGTNDIDNCDFAEMFEKMLETHEADLHAEMSTQAIQPQLISSAKIAPKNAPPQSVAP